MAISEANFAFVRELLAKRSAIILDQRKMYLVESRLLPIARRAGCDSIDELVQRMRVASDDLLRRQVIEAMTTNETSFFRDTIPFDTIRSVILPDLFRRRQATRRLHLWSAGCASGQEPYSLAMLLCEDFPDARDWNIRLLGSDLSAEMLDKARAGLFTTVEVERGLPPGLKEKYFHRTDQGWQIAELLRKMVDFRQFNLHEDWPALPAMDVILLRNVLVYFDLATQKAVLRKVRDVLRPDGYLVMGGAETALHVDDAFDAVREAGFSYYQLKK
jgi:chemotaxis protein methyltransferase CheR